MLSVWTMAEGYPDVIHTLFILGADNIHTVRGVWACMWSHLVMRGCVSGQSSYNFYQSLAVLCCRLSALILIGYSV